MSLIHQTNFELVRLGEKCRLSIREWIRLAIECEKEDEAHAMTRGQPCLTKLRNRILECCSTLSTFDLLERVLFVTRSEHAVMQASMQASNPDESAGPIGMSRAQEWEGVYMSCNSCSHLYIHRYILYRFSCMNTQRLHAVVFHMHAPAELESVYHFYVLARLRRWYQLKYPLLFSRLSDQLAGIVRGIRRESQILLSRAQRKVHHQASSIAADGTRRTLSKGKKLLHRRQLLHFVRELCVFVEANMSDSILGCVINIDLPVALLDCNRFHFLT